MVRVLGNAFETDKIHHAYLLTGIRGIGKTTTARIIAKGLNCTSVDKPTITPCDKCEACREISESRHIDVLEMDAASRTGIDDIRELIENTNYLPTSTRYKVYIIDEIHMLSKNAFNALLKTLEEPPPHVKFIFATTEIRKIPITILSRCQRFDLRRVEAEQLATHLTNIAKKEGFAVEPDAVGLIANVAEGSVRDALSLLDQAIAYAEDSTVKTANIEQMLCLTDKAKLFALYEHVLAGNVEQALGELNELYHAGGDPILITQGLMEISHLVSRMKIIPALKNATDIPEAERKQADELAEKLGMASLAMVWQMLLKGLQEVNVAPSPLMALEMLLIRIAYLAEIPSPLDLVQHTETKKKTLNNKELAKTSIVKDEPEQNPNPSSFEELVALFSKEPLLQHFLMSVELVNFEKGKVEVFSKKPLPADFKSKTEKSLHKWTGKSWKIIISDNKEAAKPSIKTQKIQKDEEEKQQVIESPLVQKVLETFPDAEIVEVS